MYQRCKALLGRNFKRRIMAQALLLIAVPAVVLSQHYFLNAAPLTSRSVRVQTSKPSAQTAHTFRFNINSSGAIGSIQFEYCSNGPFTGSPCTAPDGLSVAAAAIASQAGVTGFSVHPSSSVNRLVLTRSSSAVAPQPVSYIIDNIINPSTPATTTFVRISTHVSEDATDPWTDDGAVLFSTDGGLGANGFVPPYLTFCVGITVAPNCTNATGNAIDMGELRFNAPSVGTSQFAGATNDVSGYTVSLRGTTMTSGNNIINPNAAPAPSAPGTSQYGINLRANTAPAVGLNPLGAGTANPIGDYNNVNQFTFRNGTIATSPNSTDFNTFTVSYMVNVPRGQPPGVYSTTATYIATALF